MESEHFLRRAFMHDGLVYGRLQVFPKYVPSFPAFSYRLQG